MPRILGCLPRRRKSPTVRFLEVVVVTVDAIIEAVDEVTNLKCVILLVFNKAAAAAAVVPDGTEI